MDLGNWLGSHGLERFEATFGNNGNVESALPHLTQDRLRELGLPLGARVRLLAAIAGLSKETEARLPLPDQMTSLPSEAAERRQITVLFSDLVGSTVLSTRMDPDLRQLISAYQKCVAQPVRCFDGFVVGSLIAVSPVQLVS